MTLQDALKRQKLALEKGDAVIINTGFERLWEKDNVRYYRTQPGLGVGAAGWLAGHNPMIVGSDTCCVEVNPNPDPNLSSLVHQMLLVARGIYLVESLKLNELVGKGIHEFGFVVQNYDEAKAKAELDRRGIGSKPNPFGGLALNDPNGLEIGMAGQPDDVARSLRESSAVIAAVSRRSSPWVAHFAGSPDSSAASALY